MDQPQSVNMPESAYRQHLPDLSSPRFQQMSKQNAHEYVDEFKTGGNPPWLHGLYMHWLDLLNEPFRGVTTNGQVQQGLYQVEDEGVPIEDIVKAASALVEILSDDKRQKMFYHVDDPKWRTWSNPEFLLNGRLAIAPIQD